MDYSEEHPQRVMKVVGGRNMPSYCERFNRLQRLAHKLRGDKAPPRGVYRFRTFEEFEEWKMSYRLGRPKKRT